MSRESARAPLAPGLPLLGSAIAAARDPCRFFVSSHRQLGPVFRVAYPGRTLTMLAGLQANRLFALEGERVFSSGRTYARVSREMGTETYPNAHDGARHAELRQLLAPSLSAMAVEPFVDRLLAMVRERAAGWAPGSVTTASAALSTLVADLVSVCTANRPAGERLSRDIDLWSTMMGAVGVGGVLPEAALYFPTVQAARRRFARFIEQALQEHRAGGAGTEREPDVLDALLAVEARHGAATDPAALLALAMVPMKNAGIYLYRLVSFTLYELLLRPELLEAVTEEVDAAFAGGEPALEDLRRLRTLPGLVLECLRLHPMALALPRVVAQEFEFGGFRFLPGETVYIAGPVTHFDPAFFPEPERFDVERFSLRRCEHRRPHVFAPFGLGPHACLARGYSQALTALVVAALVRSTRLRLEPEGYRISSLALPNPIPEAKFRMRVLGPREPATGTQAAPAARERLSTALWELTPERRAAVFAGLAESVVPAGATVFRQGDPPDRFYVIRRGEVEVLLEPPGGEPRQLARLGPGDHFGEIGLLQNVPRTATVRALSEVQLLGLDREAFNELVVDADVTRHELVQLMGRRAMAMSLARALPQLGGEALGRLAGVSVRRRFEPGETIVRQGERAEHFYVLTQGRVELGVQPPSGPEIVVARLEAVDFFGEVGMLQRRPRSATVRAVDGPVTVLEIARERFEEMVAGSEATRDDLARVAAERLLGLAQAAGRD